MPNIIDSLVVQLSLDSKKMGEGAINAANRLQDLENRTKKLARQEELANRAAEISAYLEKQRTQNTQRTSAAARQLEVQSTRTRLELSAASKVGVDLFAAFRGGMVGLAGALGVGALGAFVQQTITAGANVERMAKTIGISSRDLQKWEQAGTNLVAGATPESIAGAFQTLSTQANALAAKGESPTALLEAANRLAPWNGGKRVDVLGNDGKMLPLQDILLNLADPVKRAGLPMANTLLGPELGGDMVALLSQGRSALQKELGSINPPNTKIDEDFRRHEQEAENALRNLGERIVNFSFRVGEAAVRLARSFEQFLSKEIPDVIAYATGKKSHDEMVAEGKNRDPDQHPQKMTPEQAHARAEGIVRWIKSDKDSWLHWGARALTGRTNTDDEARVNRLTDLMQGGLSAAQAESQLRAEEAGGKLLAVPKTPTGGNGISFSNVEKIFGLPAGLLARVRQVESSGNDRAVSPAGAMGGFQFMPDTAKQYGLDDPYDINQSAYAAGHLLSDLYAKYRDWKKALAGYNWGPGDATHPRLDADIFGAPAYTDEHGKYHPAVSAHGNNWLAYAPLETQRYISRFAGRIPDEGGGADGGITIVQNGPVNITTQATDAAGIKKDWTKKVAANAFHGPA